MSRGLAAAAATVVVTQLGLGWYLGFAPWTGLAFWLLTGLTVLPAWRLTRALFTWSGLADALVRASTLTFAAIALVGLTLGSVGLLGIVPYLVAFGSASAVAFVLLRPREQVVIPPPRLPIPAAAIVLSLVAFVIAVGLVQSPLTLYDSVSYHLVFPARWLLDRRLSIVQTPFSDPAQAYQPANGELFFLWLMLPFHGDLAARIGQLPFLLVAAISLYAIARRCGARAGHAVYAPLFFMLARPVVEQAVGADVDLVCAAAFLASIHLGLIAVESDRPRDWALWGISVGLFLGSKYLALVYVVVLLALPLLRGVRLNARWAIPGIIAFALPWYARNWIIGGSPIYPASLQLLGILVARGAFTREAMNNSVFHVTTLRLLPAIATHAFGAAAALVWVPCAALGLATLVARRRWWPGAYVAAVPIAMLALFWTGVPDNADSRFLLPAVALASVPLTFPFGANRRWNAGLHSAYLAAAAWIIVGSQRQIPMALPWFMGNWLALDGVVSSAGLPLFAGAVAIATAVLYAVARRPAYTLPMLTALGCAGCAALTISAAAAKAGDGSSLLELSPTYIRAGMIGGWDWLRQHVEHGAVANTGNNLPYPLFGEHLSNRVYYVNIDRHADWRFHDYARIRSRAGAAANHDLAQPSGQLMPLAEFRPPSEASRPRFERWEGNADAWMQNLRAARITHLFVSVLSPYEIGDVWHNEGGFPVEDEWARSHPREFTVLYENGTVRIYAVIF